MGAAEVAVPLAEAIARLNDALRKEGVGGSIMVTRGVIELEGFDRQQLTECLAAYEAFDADNDPHRERDFGDLTLWGADLLWKTNYYDAEFRSGSDDLAEPAVTQRVLTVMLAGGW